MHIDTDLSNWDDEDCKKLKIDVTKVENLHDELHRAIAKHHCRTIRQLLEDGVKPCTTNDEAKSCFILARSSFILKKLLEYEPSGVNCQDSKGRTLLMLCKDFPTFALICMKYKPDVNSLNNDGNNILFHLLKTRKRFNIWQLEQLVELGLDVNAVNSKGETALEYAIRKRVDASIIETLFEAGVQLPPLNTDFKKIIIKVMKDKRVKSRFNIKLLEGLMKYEVDVNIKDSNGKNVMYHITMKYVTEEMRYGGPNPFYSELEELLIMLLQKNCEVQGLDITFEEDLSPGNHFEDKMNIISIFAQNGPSVKFLEQLVNRGLYNWTESSNLSQEELSKESQPISPLTACLRRLCNRYIDNVRLREILHTCNYLISIGVDVTHRTRNRDLRFDVGKCCRKFNIPPPAVVEDLKYPDAFFFFGHMVSNNIDEILEKENAEDFEQLLRLLLSFSPYPPLFVVLLRFQETWDKPENLLKFEVLPEETFITRLLIKIGGPVPLGTCYYKAITNYMQNVAVNTAGWQEMLDSVSEVPSLRSLSRDAFRATVKKTCLTGLDFSEYRVLCQGEMVPLPEEILKLLEFRA